MQTHKEFILKKITILFFLLFFLTKYQFAQEKDASSEIILNNMDMQIRLSDAINSMYNFNFIQAETEFQQLALEYPEHPIAYFLLGLSTWWQILPNLGDESKDELLLTYMDKSIEKAEVLYEENENNMEAAFFLAASYGFKGRLYGERNKYLKAIGMGKKAFKYYEIGAEQSYLSPEFLLGKGLFNYYLPYVREKYPLLKPFISSKGNIEVGIESLVTVSNNAFYTRTEAQYYLTQIYAKDAKTYKKAYEKSRYLHVTFPNNSYFHQSFMIMCYGTAKFSEALEEAEKLIENYNNQYFGYGKNYARRAYFIAATILYKTKKNPEKAKPYFEKSIQLAEELGKRDQNYYYQSLIYLGNIAEEEGNEKLAKEYYKKLKKDSKRKSDYKKQAKEYLKDL